MNEGCVFCKIVSGAIPAQIAYNDKDALAFKDIKPMAPVHMLIIPKAHIERLTDIKENDAALMGKLVNIANRLAKENRIESSGYRLVLNCNKDAGQEVFHVHLHLLGGRKFTWPPG